MRWPPNLFKVVQLILESTIHRHEKNVLVFIIFIVLFAYAGLAKSADITETLSGLILLRVEENGEAWYLYPEANIRYYLGRPGDAFEIMRGKDPGISNVDLLKISTVQNKIDLNVAANEKNNVVDTGQ